MPNELGKTLDSNEGALQFMEVLSNGFGDLSSAVDIRDLSGRFGLTLYGMLRQKGFTKNGIDEIKGQIEIFFSKESYYAGTDGKMEPQPPKEN